MKTLKMERAQDSNSRPIVWCIAASDSGGGAGIQADLFTVNDLGCHGCSIITAITAQNSLQVQQTDAVTNAMLVAQLDCLLVDMPPQAIKIGMLANQAQLNCLADWLMVHVADVPLIVDPVMGASTGDYFNRQPLDYTPLLAIADMFTPNVAELSEMTGQQYNCAAELVSALATVSTVTPAHLLLKGGDVTDHNGKAEDILYLRHPKHCAAMHANRAYLLCSARLNTNNTHGTGCTLASAIAAFIALAWVIPDAVVLAKAYVNQGLAAGYQPGAGAGVLARPGMPTLFAYFPQVITADGPLTQWPTATVTSTFQFASAIYPVVNDLKQLIQLLQSGCRTLQLRIKSNDYTSIEATIKHAVSLAEEYQAQLFINDHWQLALAHHAYGVHLGQEDLLSANIAALKAADIKLGLSSHSYFEALLAINYQPDYLALGHIFATTTKVMPSLPQGLSRLRHYVATFSSSLPTVAIGGIDASNLDDIQMCGVQAAAVVRAVTQADDIGVAFTQLQQQWQQHFQPQGVM